MTLSHRYQTSSRCEQTSNGSSPFATSTGSASRALPAPFAPSKHSLSICDRSKHTARPLRSPTSSKGPTSTFFSSSAMSVARSSVFTSLRGELALTLSLLRTTRSTVRHFERKFGSGSTQLLRSSTRNGSSFTLRREGAASPSSISGRARLSTRSKRISMWERKTGSPLSRTSLQ